MEIVVRSADGSQLRALDYNLQWDDKLAGLLAGANTQTPAAPVPAAAPANIPPAEAPVQSVYKIGDTGPGGGIVFYDKGSREGGWQYMEVSKSSLGNSEWRPQNDVRTGTAMGSGKRNTLVIVDYLGTNGGAGNAAQICADYRGGGYKDWFLPSKDELNTVYTSLVGSYFVLNHGMSGWQETYWSSSQDGGSEAWCQAFNDGRQNSTAKWNKYGVRAVREF
jgi:hypothetical protein